MIKGRTKTYKQKDDGKCNKDTQVKVEIEWHYTTNVSGKHVFQYTGKEIGKDYFDPTDKKIIKPGDTVLYKKSGHMNDGFKALVTKITKSLTKKELAEKNISLKTATIGDTYSLKFKNPPTREKWPRQYPKLKNVLKANIEKIPAHKDYICIKNIKTGKETDTRKKIKGTPSIKEFNDQTLKLAVASQMKKTFKNTRYYSSREEEVQPEFKIENVLASNTKGVKVKDPYELVEPTQAYVISYASFREIFDIRKSKTKSKKYGGVYYKIKVEIRIGLRDTTVNITSGNNINLALRCDERWHRVNSIFRELKDESVETVNSLFPQSKSNPEKAAEKLETLLEAKARERGARPLREDIEEKVGGGEIKYTRKNRLYKRRMKTRKKY